MKWILYDLLIEPFEERYWIGYVVGIIAWLFTIALVAGLLWLSVWLIDSSFLPIKEKDGIVTNKYIVPAHSTTTFVMSGKVMIPITNYYDTSYEIEITIDGLKDNVSMYQDCWNDILVGQKINCKYTNGRLMKSLYIKSF